jgi:TPR repeat protein
MPAEPQETKVQPQSEADAKMVDLPSSGPEVEVKLDDTKKIINPDEESVDVSETASSEEMEDYGVKVKSRIDKLTKRLRESERREQAAIQYAQGVQSDSAQIRQRAAQVNSGYMAEFGDRVTSQIAEAKKEMKEAMDLGDTEKQVEAQTKLSRLAIEEERVASHKAQRERLAKEMQARGVDPRQPQMPRYQPPQQQPPPPPDPKAEEWAEKNEWFGEDEPMTLTSFSIHRKLMEEGFDPKADSYYNEVDKRMRDTFPHKFESSTPTQSVAAVNRGGPTRRKGTVRLTPSQVAISKKLGVPLSEYAKYVKE